MGIGSALAGGAATQAVKGAIDFGFDTATSALGAKRSYKYWKKQLKAGPYYQMMGLRRAGINPILAAGGKGLGGGGNVSIGGQTRGGGGGGPSLISTAKEYAGMSDQLKILHNEERRTAAQADSAVVKSADDLRRFKALEEAFLDGRMDRILEGAEQPGLEKQISQFLNWAFGGPNSAKGLDKNQEFNEKNFPDREMKR